MAKLEDFTIPTARPLPVVVLADTSGSMSGDGKIEALNQALRDMVESLSEEDGRAEIQVAVITFGGTAAELHIELESVWNLSGLPVLRASGKTPMGDAFRIARELIDDRDRIPSRAYQPTLVLISDGRPTDGWREQLDALLASPRASKAARLALAIGDDADRDVLNTFLGGGTQVMEGRDARSIKQFFRWVTMSVSSRSRSVNPDDLEPIALPDLDDYDF